MPCCTELVATGLSWPAGGLSSFSVYNLGEISYHAKFKLLERFGLVGMSDVRMREIPGSNPMTAKVVLSGGESVTCSSFGFFRMILVRLASEEIVLCLS
jgi:hypothetical protein